MSFLAIDAQKAYFTLQRNQLQFEMTVVMQTALQNQKAMDAIKAQKVDDGNGGQTAYDYENDPDYIAYEQMDEMLETEKDSLDSQIQLLDSEISSLKTMVNNNIKNSCTLNLIGG